MPRKLDLKGPKNTKDGRTAKLLAQRQEWRMNQSKPRSGTHPTEKENEHSWR